MFAKLLCSSLVAVFAISGYAYAVDESGMLTDEQLKQAYEKAAQSYQIDYPAKANLTASPANKNILQPPKVLQNNQDVAMISKEARVFHNENIMADLIPLESVNIAIDVENRSLKEVVKEIVKRAEYKTGLWKVKWRLRPENSHILNSRVNLTAETTFGEFMDHLLDRINNMTGVQLSVSVFDMSRIIVISDTY